MDFGGVAVVVPCGVLWRGFPWWQREGGLAVVCVGGGWGWRELVGVFALCLSGLLPGGGRGGWCGGGTAGGGGAGVGAVLDGSLDVLPGRVGVSCACRAVLAVQYASPPCLKGFYEPCLEKPLRGKSNSCFALIAFTASVFRKTPILKEQSPWARRHQQIKQV